MQVAQVTSAVDEWYKLWPQLEVPSIKDENEHDAIYVGENKTHQKLIENQYALQNLILITQQCYVTGHK